MTQTTKEREAGRELDAEIAERVFGATWSPTESGSPTEEALAFRGDSPWRPRGWSLVWRYSNGKPLVYKQMLPEYSADIRPAFDVIEAMKMNGYRWRIGSPVESDGPTFAAFWNPDEQWCPNYTAECWTPALAICLAALKALDAQHPDQALLSSPLSSDTSNER